MLKGQCIKYVNPELQGHVLSTELHCILCSDLLIVLKKIDKKKSNSDHVALLFVT